MSSKKQTLCKWYPYQPPQTSVKHPVAMCEVSFCALNSQVSKAGSSTLRRTKNGRSLQSAFARCAEAVLCAASLSSAAIGRENCQLMQVNICIPQVRNKVLGKEFWTAACEPRWSFSLSKSMAGFLLLLHSWLQANKSTFSCDFKDFKHVRESTTHVISKCSANEGPNQDFKARTSSHNTEFKQVLHTRSCSAQGRKGGNKKKANEVICPIALKNMVPLQKEVRLQK